MFLVRQNQFVDSYHSLYFGSDQFEFQPVSLKIIGAQHREQKNFPKSIRHHVTFEFLYLSRAHHHVTTGGSQNLPTEFLLFDHPIREFHKIDNQFPFENFR